MQDDEQAIRDLLAQWHEATAAGDLPRLLTLMADDVVFLTPGQPPMRKDAFAAGFQAAIERVRIEPGGEIEELQIIAADWAYCWTHLSVTVTPLPAGALVRRSGYTLTLLRKQAGGVWVVARDANMLTVEPPASA
jgi:uncharacterized protein (TIGR02246 family)